MLTPKETQTRFMGFIFPYICMASPRVHLGWISIKITTSNYFCLKQSGYHLIYICVHSLTFHIMKQGCIQPVWIPVIQLKESPCPSKVPRYYVRKF